MTSDKNRWSTSDLQRYYALLKKHIDSAVLPDCALSDDEEREIERFRLGLVEHIDAVPVPAHGKHFPITERAVVEQDGRVSKITTLAPRPATDASDIESESRVLSPAPAPPAPRPKPSPVPALTAEDWDACGMYLLNRVPTTTYGDARAQQILSGEIPIEQAKREEQARRRANMGRPGISSPYL